MASEELLKQQAAENMYASEATLSEVKPNNAEANGVTLPNIALLGFPIAFSLVFAALFLMVSKTWVSTRDEILVKVKPLNQAPCRNCKFFSNNLYLKCAIHPSVALTPKATDCSDYCPKDSKFFSKETSED